MDTRLLNQSLEFAGFGWNLLVYFLLDENG